MRESTFDAHVQLYQEERMRRFIKVLVDGGTLILHLDTWIEVQTYLPKLPPALTLPLLLNRVNVIPSEYMKRGDMMAFKPHPFKPVDFFVNFTPPEWIWT